MTWHLSQLKLTSWQSEPQQPRSLDRPKLYQSPIRNLSFSFWVFLLPASSLPDLRGGPLLSWQMAASLLVPSTDKTPTTWRRVFGFHISIMEGPWGWECALGWRRPQVQRMLYLGDYLSFHLPLSLSVLSLEGKCDYGQALTYCSGSRKPVGQDGHPNWPTRVKHTLRSKVRFQRGSRSTRHAGSVRSWLPGNFDPWISNPIEGWWWGSK